MNVEELTSIDLRSSSFFPSLCTPLLLGLMRTAGMLRDICTSSSVTRTRSACGCSLDAHNASKMRIAWLVGFRRQTSIVGCLLRNTLSIGVRRAFAHPSPQSSVSSYSGPAAKPPSKIMSHDQAMRLFVPMPLRTEPRFSLSICGWLLLASGL